jgi:serine/threonine-protein kinase
MSDQGPGWSGVILVSLITSILVVFGVRFAAEQGILPSGRPPPASEAPAASNEVPGITGMTLATATELLRARGLTVVARAKEPHESLPADSVVAQDPLAGSVLPPGGSVAVTLSSGAPSQAPLPDVSGKPYEEAARLLQAAGFKVRATGGAEDGTEAPEPGTQMVQTSEPAAGTLLTSGAEIALKVAPAGAVVPKVVGMMFGRAKKEIEAAGFTLGKVRERYSDFHDAFVVLEQTPAAGSLAAKGAAIELVRNEE